MMFKVLKDFSCTVVDANAPEGKLRKFRRQERIAGEKKEIHSDNRHCNFMANDFLAIGMPLDAISPDGRQ